ncbi:MAG: BMP family protein [Fimbriimonadaceae bacterium]
MNRWVCLATALLAMAGCTAPTTTSGSASPGSKPLTVGIVFDTGGLGDKSFNDSAYRGLQRAEKELGVKVLKVESTKESDYETNLAQLAEQGAELVIGVGISMRPALEKVAPTHKETKFVSIDGAPLDMENVRTIQFKEEEGSYLVGYLAGLVSKTGKLGFVGGQEIPLIKKFEYGYRAGALAANPKIEVLPAKFTGNWDNQDTAKVAANLLFGQGADIVYHAAGRAGLGVIAAAKDSGKLAIGVDSDQDDLAPGSVLTSMVKNVDESLFLTIQDLKDGKFTAGVIVYGLKEGGVGTTSFTHTEAMIGEENIAKLEEAKKGILDGTIQVPSDAETFAAATKG